MIETLANLKNNKIGNKKTSVGQQNFDIAADAVNKMKKFLGGLSKKQTSSVTLCLTLFTNFKTCVIFSTRA